MARSFFDTLEKNVNNATKKTTLNKLEKAGDRYVKRLKSKQEKREANSEMKRIKQKIRNKKRVMR